MLLSGSRLGAVDGARHGAGGSDDAGGDGRVVAGVERVVAGGCDSPAAHQVDIMVIAVSRPIAFAVPVPPVPDPRDAADLLRPAAILAFSLLTMVSGNTVELVFGVGVGAGKVLTVLMLAHESSAGVPAAS